MGTCSCRQPITSPYNQNLNTTAHSLPAILPVSPSSSGSPVEVTLFAVEDWLVVTVYQVAKLVSWWASDDACSLKKVATAVQPHRVVTIWESLYHHTPLIPQVGCLVLKPDCSARLQWCKLPRCVGSCQCILLPGHLHYPLSQC